MRQDIIKEIENDLTSLPWFLEVGNTIAQKNSNLIYVDSSENARSFIFSEDWEYVTQEAQATLSVLLNNKYRQHFSDWNSVAKVARDIYINQIRRHLPIAKAKLSCTGLDDIFSWDIIHIVIEGYFKRVAGFQHNLRFCRLLEVYRAGRIPCGYEFSEPIEQDILQSRGRVMVY